MALPPIGEVQYGIIVIPVERFVEWTITHSYDPADRHVIFDTYSLTVAATIAVDAPFPGPTTDAQGAPATGNDLQMLDIQNQLSREGQNLLIKGLGCGTFDIPNIQKDIKWGPKPRMLQWKPLAGENAADILWRVEFCLPRMCDDPQYNGIVHFNYTPTYSRDKIGYDVRTINGTFSIAAVRPLDSNDLTGITADDFITQAMGGISVPKGWQRTTTQRTLSNDKAGINFTIVDAELPVILPAKVAESNLRYHVTSDKKLASGRMISTLSGSYSVVNGEKKVESLRAFIAEAKNRIAEQGDVRKIPVHFSMDENVYGSEAGSITLSWIWFRFPKEVAPDLSGFGVNIVGGTVTGIAQAIRAINVGVAGVQNLLGGGGGRAAAGGRALPGLAGGAGGGAAVRNFGAFNAIDLIPSSGIWRPIDNDWKKWSADMQSIWSPLGRTGIRSSGDVIIDLCDQSDPQIHDQVFQVNILGPGSADSIKFGRIKNDANTFLRGDNQVIVGSTQNVVRHKPSVPPGFAGVAQPGAFAPGNPSIKPIGAAPQGARSVNNQAGFVDDIIQSRVSPSVTVSLTGWAMRAAFPVPIPVISNWGGSTPVLSSVSDWAQGSNANLGGVPIYYAWWNLVYILPHIPESDLPIPGNPAIQVLETSTSSIPQGLG